ncbi:hypothetical protein [Rubellimicrobium mesophilum]|nr:hypothetical protein [Rubellimicrobium mesophilum]
MINFVDSLEIEGFWGTKKVNIKFHGSVAQILRDSSWRLSGLVDEDAQA